MRRISSRQREERISGRLDDAADASYLLTKHPNMRAPLAPRSTTAPNDFTAQVMARIATPPPLPDPRLERARYVRAKAGFIARVYITLILAASVSIALLALVAPWTLVTVVAGAISVALLLVTGLAFIARMTGGFVSGLGVIYAAMFAALTPSLLMLWRRIKRHRSRFDQ